MILTQVKYQKSTISYNIELIKCC